MPEDCAAASESCSFDAVRCRGRSQATVLGRAEGVKAKAAQRDLHGEPEGACARNGHTFYQLHKLHRLADTSDLQA